MFKKLGVLLLIVILLSACATHRIRQSQTILKDGPPAVDVDVSRIPNAVPKVERLSHYGNPASYNVWGKKYYVMQRSKGYKAKGFASWYGNKFHHKRTSSGEPYNMFLMTAAHRTLPIPSYATVTNLKNGKQIIVKINDRGPFHSKRLIDLSYVAAKKLDIVGHGTGLVQIETIDASKKRNGVSLATHQAKAPKITLASKKLKLLPTSSQSKKPLYIQLGAFKKKKNAEQFLHKIKHIIENPVKVIAQNKAKHIYKVQIGPLKDLAMSDSLSEKLKLAGLGQGMTLIN